MQCVRSFHTAERTLGGMEASRRSGEIIDPGGGFCFQEDHFFWLNENGVTSLGILLKSPGSHTPQPL